MFKLNVHKGIDIPKNKDLTMDKSIENMESPSKLYFPMTMHIGKPANPVIEIGDLVKVGSLIGEKDGAVSANVHSSVSGKVVDIIDGESFRGENKIVVIENDFKEEKEYMKPLDENISVDDLISRISDAGIVGKGGAGFPTAVKFDVDKKNMKYMIINGAECEPYSTTDYRVMMEYGEEILKIADAINKIYDLEITYIAIEKHNKEAISNFEKLISQKNYKNIEVKVLENSYPQGDGNLQAKNVIDIEIDKNQRGGDVGTLQSNVSTIKAIYDAVFEGKPLIDRVVTVTGEMIKEPKNLIVKNGTRVEDVIKACSGLIADDITMINGGPMMGKPFDNLNLASDKTTTTLLFIEKKELKKESPCIRCNRCIANCPMGLQPIIISNAYNNNEIDKAPALRADACISCGLCTYGCPANIPLLENIQALNKAWKEKNNA